jgi:hypothetical protein
MHPEADMISPSKRKQIEELFYGTMDRLDPTGANSKRYREMFGAMDAKEFSAFAERMAKDEDFGPYLSVMPWVNEPSIGDIKKAAAFLKVPLDEHVFFPHQSTADGRPIRTNKPVPVGYLMMRRLQQVLKKKNTQSIDTRQRNPVTGQVTGDSKVARDSDSENYALTAIGADAVLRELHGPRADNVSAMNDLYRDLSVQGFARLGDLTNDVGKKTTLNAFDVYLLGAGLRSDLLSTGDVLFWTKRAALKA